MDIAFRFFQPYKENVLEALGVFKVRAEVCNGASGQNLLGMNCLPFADGIVYLLICLWCV
jgi:hypothetical protein